MNKIVEVDWISSKQKNGDFQKGFMNVRKLIHVYGLYKDFSEFSSLLIYLSIRKVSISPVSIADIPDIRLFFSQKSSGRTMGFSPKLRTNLLAEDGECHDVAAVQLLVELQ